MWERTSAWDQRFRDTFSRTATAFYDEFAAYRDALTSPGGNACGAL